MTSCGHLSFRNKLGSGPVKDTTLLSFLSTLLSAFYLAAIRTLAVMIGSVTCNGISKNSVLSKWRVVIREIWVISFRLRQSETIESFQLTKQQETKRVVMYINLYFNHYYQINYIEILLCIVTWFSSIFKI